MFTLICVLVGWMVVVEFIVMFSSSKVNTRADPTDPRRPFSQLASLDQQLRTSVPPLGRAVQEASVWMSSSLSISGPGG